MNSKFSKATTVDAQAINRRNFLCLGRLGVLGLIVSGLYGLSKRSNSSRHLETCVDIQGETGCRQCTNLSACGHPKALSIKQFISKIKE